MAYIWGVTVAVAVYLRSSQPIIFDICAMCVLGSRLNQKSRLKRVKSNQNGTQTSDTMHGIFFFLIEGLHSARQRVCLFVQQLHLKEWKSTVQRYCHRFDSTTRNFCCRWFITVSNSQRIERKRKLQIAMEKESWRIITTICNLRMIERNYTYVHT